MDPNGRLYNIVAKEGLDLTNPLAVREFIVEFEKVLETHPDAIFGNQFPLEHTFTDGIYCRQITIPAGFLLTGRIHKHEHPNFLLKGRVSYLTEHTGVQIIEGPLFMVSKPGTKRLLYTHTEVVWTTIHHNPDNKTDIDKLEDFLAATNYNDYENFLQLEVA